MEPVVWSTSKSTQWNHIKNTGYHDSIGKVFCAARKISWLQGKNRSKMMQKNSFILPPAKRSKTPPGPTGMGTDTIQLVQPNQHRKQRSLSFAGKTLLPLERTTTNTTYNYSSYSMTTKGEKWKTKAGISRQQMGQHHNLKQYPEEYLT